MTLKKKILFLVAIITCLTTAPSAISQHSKTYQQMSPAERSAFVSAQARRIAREMSGTDYQFTPAFEAAIQRSVDYYVQRIGREPGRDTRAMFERGQPLAGTLIASFRKHEVSPLIGLYLPAVESAYINIQSPNEMGALGMFQFLPKTGEQFGLSKTDLLDVEKSAGAAARYIARSLKRFSADPMKEALALLAYNRGANNVERDLGLLLTTENRGCSICALTANSHLLDSTFQNESVHYVPRFFGAAIVGENPKAFDLQTEPLSSFQPSRSRLW